jgi:hypothetical protein
MPLAQRLVCPFRISGLRGKPNSSQPGDRAIPVNDHFFLNLLNNPPFLKDKKVAGATARPFSGIILL